MCPRTHGGLHFCLLVEGRTLSLAWAWKVALVSSLRSYIVPACLSLAIFTALSFVENTPRRPTSSRAGTRQERLLEPDLVSLPHGQLLTVVVEGDAFYLGNTRVGFDHLAEYLRRRVVALHPNYAIIVGTETARYGNAITALVTVQQVLEIEATLETRNVPAATRRPEIKSLEYWWQTGDDLPSEDEESAVTADASGTFNISSEIPAQ